MAVRLAIWIVLCAPFAGAGEALVREVDDAPHAAGTEPATVTATSPTVVIPKLAFTPAIDGRTEGDCGEPRVRDRTPLAGRGLRDRRRPPDDQGRLHDRDRRGRQDPNSGRDAGRVPDRDPLRGPRGGTALPDGTRIGHGDAESASDLESAGAVHRLSTSRPLDHRGRCHRPLPFGPSRSPSPSVATSSR